MKDLIIHKLYNGEIYPAAQIVSHQSEYKETSSEYSEYRKRISNCFGEDVEEHMDELRSHLFDMELKETFAYGLRLGLFLMMELLEESE